MLNRHSLGAALTRIVLADGTDFDLSGASEVVVTESSVMIQYPDGGRIGNGGRFVFLSSSEWRRVLFNEPKGDE